MVAAVKKKEGFLAQMRNASRLPAALAVVIVLCLSFGSRAFAQPAPTVPNSSQTVSTYPDSTKGLQDLIVQIVKLVKKNDLHALHPYLESMLLPDPDDWFREAYGDKVGSRLAEYYVNSRAALRAEVYVNVQNSMKSGAADPFIAGFPSDCIVSVPKNEFDPSKTQRTIYVVLLLGRRVAGTVGYFTYTNGAFRFLGGLKDLSVASHVKPGILIHKVLVKYPAPDRKGGLDGQAVLRGTITKDGSVRELSIVSDSDSFVGSAAKAAVSQWRYSPWLVNGKPAAVHTCFKVNLFRYLP